MGRLGKFMGFGLAAFVTLAVIGNSLDNSGDAGAGGAAASSAAPGVAEATASSSFGQLVLPLLVLAVWAGLVFIGAAGRAAKAKHTARSVLMAGEEVIAEALQHRAFALFSRRAAVLITASRVVTVRRGLLGGFKMTDIQWKDLTDATIEQNILGDILGSNLAFRHSGSAGTIEVRGVPSEAASAIYSRAQLEEQAWEEKRRVRQMEEMRAAAGGVVVHAGGPAAAAGRGGGLSEQIGQAKALLDTGAISDAEFQEMKAKILAG